jgi:hypothetical protein
VRVDHSLLKESDWPEDAFNPPPARQEPQEYVGRLWYQSAGRRVRLEREFDGRRSMRVTQGDAEDVGESLALRLAQLFDPAPLLGVALCVALRFAGDTVMALRLAEAQLVRDRDRGSR